VLEWRLSPVTAIMWLNTYLQLLQEMTRSKQDSEPSHFVIQKFSGCTFVQVSFATYEILIHSLATKFNIKNDNS